MKSDVSEIINKVAALHEAGDSARALEYLRSNLDATEPDILNWAGYLNEIVFGFEGLRESIDFYRIAANLGDFVACYNLGVCYEQMDNAAEAQYWFERSMTGGNISATLKLIIILLKRGGDFHDQALNIARSLALSSDDLLFDENLINEISELSKGKIEFSSSIG